MWLARVRLALIGPLILLVAACALAGARFLVTDLEVAGGQGEFAVGDQVAIAAVVQNAGGVAGTYGAELTINGAAHGRQQVELAPGESKMLQFVFEADAPGSYEVRLGEASTAFQVATAAATAIFEVSTLEVVSPEGDVLPGDQVTVVATVRNVGTADGTYRSDLMVNGTAPIHSGRAAQLAAGETGSVELTFRAGQPGNYDVCVGDAHVALRVVDASATTIKIGDSGALVLRAQERLVAHGFEVLVDGIFGPYTHDAVRAFQQHHGLVADGIVDPETWAALEAVHIARPLPTAAPTPATTPTPAAPASFAVSDLAVTPSDVDRGDEVLVTVTVTNVGGTAGSYPVRLFINGKVDQTRSVELAAGEQTTVNFTIKAGKAGRYQIEVDERSAVLAVRAIERPASGTVLLNNLRGGRNVLTFRNRAGRDVVLVLAKASDTSRSMLAVYVRAGKNRTIKQVKDGRYTVFYHLGDRWDSGAGAFTSNASYLQSRGELNFTSRKTARGYTYTTYTVTLDPVRGGDPLHDVGEGGFPSRP